MGRHFEFHAPVPLEGSYATIEEALAGLTALEEAFRVSNDRRAIFVGAYITITSAMQQTIGTGQFERTTSGCGSTCCSSCGYMWKP